MACLAVLEAVSLALAARWVVPPKRQITSPRKLVMPPRALAVCLGRWQCWVFLLTISLTCMARLILLRTIQTIVQMFVMPIIVETMKEKAKLSASFKAEHWAVLRVRVAAVIPVVWAIMNRLLVITIVRLVILIGKGISLR